MVTKKDRIDEIVFFPIPISELEIMISAAVTRALNRQQTEPEPSGFITRARVCELLHISNPTVHNWIKQGKLKAYHVGGRTLFKESEVMGSIKQSNS